jgi:MarR family
MRTSSSASTTLDRVLELFERAGVSATEMRVLLALRDRRDATIAELADVLDTQPTEITRAGRRLAMRGLIRWHHGGTPGQALLDGTVAGAETIDVLLADLGPATAVDGESFPDPPEMGLITHTGARRRTGPSRHDHVIDDLGRSGSSSRRARAPASKLSN